MTLHRRHVIALAVAASIGLGLWLVPSRRLAHDRLPESGRLPKAARAVLASRMERHGETMSELMQRLVLLDYEGAKTEAQRIREEPSLARPLTGDATELNTLLPARFFELQDELKSRAAAIEEAAKQNDSQKLLAGYSSLSHTCMSCHQLYLYGDQ